MTQQEISQLLSLLESLTEILSDLRMITTFFHPSTGPTTSKTPWLTRARNWILRPTSPPRLASASFLNLSPALSPEIARAKTAEETEISVNPNVLLILLHLGGVLRLVKDIEKGVADVIQGKASIEDAKLILNDVSELLSSGVFKIPGLTQEQMNLAIADLQKAF